ncbi:MAG: hypothetical protein ACRDSE_18550 [Pseudonocardiaceae bacterium]
MIDVLDHTPLADDDTADVLATATLTLAWLRGLPDPDPAARIHLLVSLRQQLDTDLLTAVLTAADPDHDYSPRQLAVLLDLHAYPRDWPTTKHK